jgi:hypothetical protein
LNLIITNNNIDIKVMQNACHFPKEILNVYYPARFLIITSNSYDKSATRPPLTPWQFPLTDPGGVIS